MPRAKTTTKPKAKAAPKKTNKATAAKKRKEEESLSEEENEDDDVSSDGDDVKMKNVNNATKSKAKVEPKKTTRATAAKKRKEEESLSEEENEDDDENDVNSDGDDVKMPKAKTTTKSKAKVAPKKTNKATAAKKRKEEEESLSEDENEDDGVSSDGDDVKMKNVNNTASNSTGLLADCKKLFGTSDLYEVLNVKKTSNLNEIKKAYHKLSLKVHPDKVDDSLKDESKLKFQALGKIYTILSDTEKRRLYDDTGVIDGENTFLSDDDRDWDNYWRLLFKKVTQEDVNEFFKTYKDSNEEKEDLKRIYLKHKGDMDLILEEMFTSSAMEDEERFRNILLKAIENKEIEGFRKFSHETKSKKEQRKKKYEKEAKEAEELKKKLGFGDGDLEKAIAQKQQARGKVMDKFFDQLEAKYAKKGGNKKAKVTNGATKKRATKKRKANDENDDDDDDDDEDFDE